MRNRTFERIGASSGLAFVALAALSGFIYPQQPRVDSPRPRRWPGSTTTTRRSKPA